MQELIEKEIVKTFIKESLYPQDATVVCNYIDSLPTTVHHEYKVGDMAEFANY